MKILIDTDIGSDVEDSFAVTLAALSKEIELVGITTVTGDTRKRALIAEKLLKQVNKKKTLIAAGMGSKNDMGGWEGKGILNQIDEPTEITLNAAQRILDLINANPKEVIIISLGPLSNIAEALSKDETLPQKVKQIIIMGGFINEAYIGDLKIPLSFEYNLGKNIYAAKKVFESFNNILLLPGDITFVQKSQWSDTHINQLNRSNKTVIKSLVSMMNVWYSEMKRIINNKNLPDIFAAPWINDSYTVAYLLWPNLFKIREDNFVVSENKENPNLIIEPTGKKLNYITDVNYEKVKDLIIEKLIS